MAAPSLVASLQSSGLGSQQQKFSGAQCVTTTTWSHSLRSSPRMQRTEHQLTKQSRVLWILATDDRARRLRSTVCRLAAPHSVAVVLDRRNDPILWQQNIPANAKDKQVLGRVGFKPSDCHRVLGLDRLWLPPLQQIVKSAGSGVT